MGIFKFIVTSLVLIPALILTIYVFIRNDNPKFDIYKTMRRAILIYAVVSIGVFVVVLFVQNNQYTNHCNIVLEANGYGI